MKLTSTAKDLEQLAVRIHQLIEKSGATVKWNQQLVDPDTGSVRQIDGVIERDGKTIHIECRDRKNPQDVTWIEELIGRRDSLQADGIIAVSLSGFGAPALSKAKAKGVITRTLSEMTEAEIKTWGRTAKLVWNYLEILEMEYHVIIPQGHSGAVTKNPRLRFRGSNLAPEFLILQELSHQLEDKLFTDRVTVIEAKINQPNLMIDQATVVEFKVKIRGRARQEKEEVLGLWNYHSLEPLPEIETVVSKHGTGLTEIIQKNDKATMLLDFSSVIPPKNCFPMTYQVDFGRVVKARIDTVGAPYRMKLDLDIVFDVKSVAC